MTKRDPRWKTAELDPLTYPPALAEILEREDREPWGRRYGLSTAWEMATEGVHVPEDIAFEEFVGLTKLLRNNLLLVAPDHPAVRSLGRLLWSVNPVLHQGKWDVAPITTRYTGEELSELRRFFAGSIVKSGGARRRDPTALAPADGELPAFPEPKAKVGTGAPDGGFGWSPRLRGRILTTQSAPGPAPAADPTTPAAQVQAPEMVRRPRSGSSAPAHEA